MKELIERLEQLSGPDYKLDAEIARSQGWKYKLREGVGHWQWHHPENDRHIQAAPPAYTASIDAAMTLFPTDGSVNLVELNVMWEQDNPDAWSAASVRWYPPHCTGASWHARVTKGPNIAIALCIASLKARGAENDAE